MRLLALLILVFGLLACEGPTGPQGEKGGAASEVYVNHFSTEEDISTWESTESSTQPTYRIENGRLFVSGGPLAITALWASPAFANGKITVDTDWISGAEGWPYGIVFRRNHVSGEGDDFYGFGIANNGIFVVGKWVNGKPLKLVDGTSHNAIVKNGHNTLSVEMADHRFRFFVNGALVRELADTSYVSGQVGVWVDYLFQEIAFDDFSVEVPTAPIPLTKPVAGRF